LVSRVVGKTDTFQQLRAEKKHFLDTIKLIAYRAETALAELAREKMHRLDDAFSLIRQLFHTEVDLIPDQQNKTLTVRLHPLTAEVHDRLQHPHRRHNGIPDKPRRCGHRRR
jgi:transposase-like protein